MKILVIAPTPFFSHRGTHIRILEEARSLERLGHVITIVTYHIGEDIHKYIDTKISVRRIRRWLFWYKKTEAGADWQKVILNIFLIVKVFNMTRKTQPDIIHAHLHEGALIGWFIQKVFFWKKIPLVTDFHGSLVGEMHSHGYLQAPLLTSIFRKVEKWISGMGDSAIVSGEENISSIRNMREDKTVHYVYDGVNIDEYAEDVSKEELRKKYGVAKNSFVVVYTGALIENKGIRYILESIPFVTKIIQNVHFVIGGFPDQWVRRYIEERNLESFVTIISPLNYFELAEVNKLGDVAIDPKDAKVRQASGKLLQYMAAGTGIICADRPTNHKYLSQKSAIFLREISAQTIVEAITRFQHDKQLFQQCRENALKDVQKLDWKQVGKKLDRIYSELDQ